MKAWTLLMVATGYCPGCTLSQARGQTQVPGEGRAGQRRRLEQQRVAHSINMKAQQETRFASKRKRPARPNLQSLIV
jgi:hypothetical protein